MATGRSFKSSHVGDVSDFVNDFTCVPCLDDGKNNEALFQCVECQTYYCERCVESHNRFVKNHTVLDEAAMKSGRGLTQQPLSTATELLTDTCDEHGGEIIKMYCKDHDVVCCSICIAMNHRSCNGVEYIPKIARSQLKNLDRARTKTKLENVKTDLQQLQSAKLEFLHDTMKCEDIIIKDLQNSSKRLQRRLKGIEISSVSVVKTKCKQIIDDVNNDVGHIDKLLKDVEHHLRRDILSTDDSQRYVNIKLMQKQTAKGKVDLNKIRRKLLEKVDYKLDTNIQSYIKDVTSLGRIMTVSEQKLTPYVNILNVVERKSDSSVASTAYTKSLQAELEKNEISSTLIKSSDLDAKLYTVVICDHQTVDETLSDIKEEVHGKTILVAMRAQRSFLDITRALLQDVGNVPIYTPKEDLLSKWKNLAGMEYVSYDRSDHSIYRNCVTSVINLVLDVIYN